MDVEYATVLSTERDLDKHLTVYTLQLKNGHVFKLAVTDQLHFESGNKDVPKVHKKLGTSQWKK